MPVGLLRFSVDICRYNAPVEKLGLRLAKQWEHLARIADGMMCYRADIEVGILIGTNCPQAVKPREVIPGGDEDPYGIRTDLVWGIVGRVCKSPLDDADDCDRTWANRILIRETDPESSPPHFTRR